MKTDIEKEIRNIIEYHCGGTYTSRQKATELILKLYNDEQAEKTKKFLCGNEYRNKEKRCLKQCGNCQGNV